MNYLPDILYIIRTHTRTLAHIMARSGNHDKTSVSTASNYRTIYFNNNK